MMSVKSYQIGNDNKVISHNNFDKDFFNEKIEIQQEMKDIINGAVIANTNVTLEKGVPKGQPLEVGIINFLRDSKKDIDQLFKERDANSPTLIEFPFDEVHKRQIVIRQVEGRQEVARVYVKGAPEIILRFCTKTLDKSVRPEELKFD